MDIIIDLLCAFVGTLAFSVLFNIDKKYYIYCGFTGMVGWAAKCIIESHTTDTIGTLAGALVVVLISRIISVWKKCPITIFMVAGIFPLIPGSSIYYTAYYFGIGDFAEAAVKGISAIKTSFAIVVGIHLIDAIPPKLFRKSYWKEKWIKLRVHLQRKN